MVVYRLYDMKLREIIMTTTNEDILYKTIANHYKKDPNCYLYVIKRANNGDMPYIAIRDEEDFIRYLKMYENNKIENKSCVELKREILDLTEKPKTRKYNLSK